MSGLLRRYYYEEAERRRRLMACMGGGPPAWILRSGGVVATLDIDFVNDLAWNANALTTVAGLLSCTRATPSAAYYTKADGTLTTFAANTLRYGTNGLLVEEARTNVILRSQQFENASWSTQTLTVTADATAAPDGTTTADLLTLAAGNGYIQQQVTLGTGATTASGYFKVAGAATRVRISIFDGAHNETWFLLSGAGSVGTNAAGNTSTITALANGWYWLTVSRTTGGANPFWSVFPTSAGDGLSALNGDTIYAWGAQMEAGAAASSYIPTTTASVTRAVDVPTFSDLTWFDGTSESIYAEWTAKNVASASVWLLDATNDVTLNEQSGMSPKLSDAGTTFAITVGNTVAAGSTAKIAARMATNDIAICMNGGTVGTDTTATQPGTLTASRLGVDLAGANSLNGYIRRVAVFKTSLLNNAALQALST